MRLARVLIAVALIFTVAGCRDYTWQDARKGVENKTYADRDLELTAQDYNKALAPKPIPTNEETGKALDLSPVVADEDRNVLPQPLVSVTVNQDVPIRDIFFELAKQAQVDLELDPEIRGSVIFTAYNRPFDQVVQRLSEIAGLRYKFENGVLRVERDLPYMKIYRVDYSGLNRSFSTEMKANTTVDASAIGASGGSGGGQNGSKSSVTATLTGDMWKEIEANLSQILQVSRYAQRQNAKTAAPLTTPNAIPAVTTAQLAGTATADATQPAAQAPTAPAQEEEKLAGTGGLGDPYYSVNRQAGLLSVFASDVQHKQVAEYLRELRQSSNTQVLIEAKVLEVTLADQYAMGIDWAELFSGDAILTTTLARPTSAAIANSAVFTVGSDGHDFRVLLSAINRFGTTRALSSPRLTVMNNQAAIMNVSENKVFFDIDVTQSPATQNTDPVVTVNSQVRSVPEGIIINVHPTVDMDTNEITMNLRPSITKMVTTVNDPAVDALPGVTLENKVPVIAVRELDSVVQMKSGETIVLGGLMQNNNESSQTGVPIASEIPLIGALFRNQLDATTKTELVILLKATVIKPHMDQTDKEMYRKFGSDRHPIAVD